MSGPRRLWVRLRTVDPRHLDGYLAAVRRAGDEARQSGAHFWGFEVDGGEGRFIEFLEGPGDEALTRLDQSTAPGLDAAAGGSGAEGAWIEADGLRCTEITEG